MRHFRILAVGGAAVLCAATLTGCRQSSTAGGNGDGTLTVAVPIATSSFDPARLDTAFGQLYWQAVYDTLIRLDAERRPVPGLATSFRYNDDQTELTLDLRRGVTFSDGGAFDAAAAKTNLDRFRKTGGPNKAMAASIERVEAAAPDRLVLHLSEPDPALLSNLASPLGAMVSPRSLESGTVAKEPVGSGPYVYDAAGAQAGTAAYTRNSSYWGKQDFPFDRLEIVTLSDPNTVLNGLKAGQLDAAPVMAAQIKSVKAQGMSVVTSKTGWKGLILADREGKTLPPLGKAEVRQAINLALDRDLFATTLIPGGTTKTDQIFSSGSGAYDPALDDMYRKDVAEAKKLMAEAGHPDGFSVTMPDLTAFAGTPSLNTAIDQQLGAIGIKVKWDKVPPQRLLTAMRRGEYPMFFTSLASKTPWEDIQLSVLPSATWNPFHTTDPELSELIRAARDASPGAAQDAAFKAVNRWLVANAWYAPIMAPDQAWASVPGLRIERQSQGASPDLVRFQRSAR
ncbi:ABC transporter substrate-binding protein [Actinomadura sp. WAC 06369]|uniref:ABC transporter substrate-binding protein n=1 Tax=Actinomadura sp. WAC 06369 TaxID=2203193 RepID=UPI0013159AA9|nr:ABC transporter substrate-binding protein [Actinomadura sp. WAC 06369]